MVAQLHSSRFQRGKSKLKAPLVSKVYTEKQALRKSEAFRKTVWDAASKRDLDALFALRSMHEYTDTENEQPEDLACLKAADAAIATVRSDMVIKVIEVLMTLEGDEQEEALSYALTKMSYMPHPKGLVHLFKKRLAEMSKEEN